MSAFIRFDSDFFAISHFWVPTVFPKKRLGAVWESIECTATDSDKNWGANGEFPDGEWKHEFCYVHWWAAPPPRALSP